MNDTIDLRAYIAIGLKWWWLFVLFAVIAAGVGYYQSSRQPTFYQATTVIMVGQSIQSSNVSTSDLYLSERLGDTYAEIAQRQPVLQGTVDALQLSDPWQSLRGRVSINQIDGTQLLEITVTANSAEEAEATADEIARQLIQLSPTELQNQQTNETEHFVRQRLESLQAKIEAGQRRLETLEAAMTGSLSAEQVQELQAEINQLEGLISGWESNHTQLLMLTESNRSPNYLALIESAQSRAIEPNVMQDTMLAAIVGLLLAAGIVFLIEYLDDSLKTPQELSEALGLTALGAIGRITGDDYQEKLITSKGLFSPEAEAYRMIRSNIQFMSIDEPARAIMITSPTPAEGKSTTVANLGVVMAQTGLQTIIVDADLRRPTQHQFFQAPNLAGLTELLRAPEADLDDYLRRTSIEGLRLLTSGAIPPNPSELLGSQRMSHLVARLLNAADMVIFDSPPALAVTDAAVLSTKSDGVVLVVQAGQTRQDAARQAVMNLEQAGATLLGGVMNRFSQKRGGYYYYNSYYAPHAQGQFSQNGAQPHAKPAPRKRRSWLPFFN